MCNLMNKKLFAPQRSHITMAHNALTEIATSRNAARLPDCLSNLPSPCARRTPPLRFHAHTTLSSLGWSLNGHGDSLCRSQRKFSLRPHCNLSSSFSLSLPLIHSSPDGQLMEPNKKQLIKINKTVNHSHIIWKPSL